MPRYEYRPIDLAIFNIILQDSLRLTRINLFQAVIIGVRNQSFLSGLGMPDRNIIKIDYCYNARFLESL